jgi:hypothetical protein
VEISKKHLAVISSSKNKEFLKELKSFNLKIGMSQNNNRINIDCDRNGKLATDVTETMNFHKPLNRKKSMSIRLIRNISDQ